MECMRQIDGSQLDGRLLQLLLAVLETGSVTAAAQRLGVTQSAVSHLLDKLRAITGDRLFVRQGRGIAPTAHALALQDPARELLRQMQQFGRGPALTPRTGVPRSPLPPTTCSASCCCPHWPGACAQPRPGRCCA